VSDMRQKRLSVGISTGGTTGEEHCQHSTQTMQIPARI
jgi:hypothetical protein